MRRCLGPCVGLFFLVLPLAAAEPQGKIVLDTWDAAYLEGAKAGYVHTLVRTFEKDDTKRFRATSELVLTVKRFDDLVTLRMETGTDEDEAGKVSAVSMKQLLGKEQQRVLTGTVDGRQLHVRVDEVKGTQTQPLMDKKIPWNDQVVGMYHQERLYRERKVKPKDRFSYLSYDPSINYVVTSRVQVKDFEEVELRGTKKKLLRVDVVPDKIEVKDAAVQLPTLSSWLDEEYTTLRSQFEVPGLGKLTLYRTTRELALEKNGAPAQIRDIGIAQLIRLNRKLARPYDVPGIVFRVTVKDDDDPATAFAQDRRQKVKNVKGSTFEMHIRALREPEPLDNPAKAGEEFLKSSYFINGDDARVKAHAAAAVGKETDAWRKARLIEKWVHQNMQNKNFTEAFATADHVARTLEGDCTEHAVLTAAMCRAAGVPSRTAFGLIYIDSMRGPAMGFHMWTEVWVHGQWLPIDATLGRGFVGASHLKISDHSWHDTQSLTPLLPVVRVVGKIGLEILSAEDR